MKEREAKLSHWRLMAVLHYDPRTGVFTWRQRTSNRVSVGAVAGQVDHHGHRYINVFGTRYAAHRLAWFYMTGVWPKEEIDHINLIKDDNRIENLREANRNENNRNVTIKRHNRSGFKGVYRHKQAIDRFVAQITIGGKPRYLGIFGSPEEAHEAYVDASSKFHGEFGRLS